MTEQTPRERGEGAMIIFTTGEFRPLNARKARMYVCGPTVYDRARAGCWGLGEGSETMAAEGWTGEEIRL